MLLLEDLGQQRLPARYLSAVLRREGIPARLVPFAGLADASAVLEEVRRAGPDLVVISQLFAHLLSEHRDLAGALRRQGFVGHICQVGPLPTLAWRELLATCPELDSVLCGEVENGIADLARAAALGTGWSTVAGLAWRSPAPVRNPHLRGGSKLDRLPSPAYEVPLPGSGGFRFVTVESSRGCYHGCAFCLPCAAQRECGRAYRVRPAAGIVNEMEARYRDGARLFLFDDEQFLAPETVRERRVASLEQELAGRGLTIAFTIKARADDVSQTLFRRLRRMGLLRVYLGLESNWQPCLDLLGKGTTEQQNAAALSVLKGEGIVADFRCLLIHPWSTLETIRSELAGLAALEDCLTTPLDFREVEVYPGTAMAGRLAAEGRPVPALLPLAYDVGDARAELLRRLCRLIFGSSSAHEAARERISQEWFQTLLWERFGGAPPPATRGRLEAEVRRLNQVSLSLWEDMVAFAANADVTDADEVNTRAAGWSARLGLACLSTAQHAVP